MITVRTALHKALDWYSPRVYVLFVVIALVCAAGLFFASLSSPATFWLNRAGIDPFTTAAECAILFALALILSVSPALRALAGKGWAWVVALWRRIPEPDQQAVKPERVPNLDILRLIAALSVIALHAAYIGNHINLWLPFGPVAVFIAISGFVIPASFTASRSWGHFAWKRFLRIAPALLCCFVAIWLVFGKIALVSAVLIYITGGLLQPASQYDGALWSLLTEEVLYAWHGLSQTIRRIWTPRTCIAAITALLALEPLFDRFAGEWPNIMSHMPALGTAFFVGNLLYFYRSRLCRIKVNWIMLACLPLMVIAWFVRLAPVEAATAVLIVLLAIRLPQWRWKWTDISYGVYISHVPCLTGAVYVLGLHGLPVWLIGYAGSIIIGTASWHVIERPSLSLKNIRFPIRNPSKHSPQPDSLSKGLS